MDFITCVFLKSPAGQVKTRLAQSVSQETARQIYKTCVEDILHNLRSLNLALFYDPPGALPELEAWLGTGYDYVPQASGDLGNRMLECFKACFARGFRKVIIIGSDIPQIAVQHITEIAERLNENPLVLSPSADGGYGAIGLIEAGLNEDLFQSIAWSTPSVLQQTLEAAKRLEYGVWQTDHLDDIDYLNDLQNFCRYAVVHQPRSKTLKLCIEQRLYA